MGRDLLFFLSAASLCGFAGSIVDSTFNNYLNETFHVTNFLRSFIELPRELPGLLTVFVSALFFFLGTTHLATLSMALMACGLVLMGGASPTVHMLFVWLFVYSLGQHLFMPLNASIGMDLAREGQTGKRLGQLNGLRNAAAILGSIVVFLGFRYLHFTFQVAFIIGAVALVVASVMMLSMKKGVKHPVGLRMKIHREYRLYYWLCILFGMRKQIFLTFAPWVLVTVYHKPTQTLATLLAIGGCAGIVFQPLLGRAIDKLGERAVLASEAFILIFVCAGYGLARSVFPESIAFLVAAGCYVVDQLLMSVGMARATYLKKIAVDPSHVTPTLAMAQSMDHVFSISIALVSGVIWSVAGYRFVFLLGAVIACVNLVSALRVRTAPRSAAAPAR